MKKIHFILSALLALAISQPAMASDDTRNMHGQHMHGALHGDKDNPCSMGGHMDMSDHGRMGMAKGAFMVKKIIDGYTVTFHIMPARADMKHGQSHSVMIKVEKDGKTFTDLVANSKVVHPDGQSESRMLMRMGDWYMATYNLNHLGKYQLMVLFKTADGVKHFGGIDYPAQEMAK